ncbi:hypothetical protein QR680_018629 [Steinernema hermaphroditum]|uniref:C-type lectin domain-containing protein n=1 Tax=Steinernema hermaphroditum TaxID=289476 RepID=A0AA39HJF0_9BILA|nr:hypothetical protein QR680_018629 [Steinernema hermaphroditum]
MKALLLLSLTSLALATSPCPPGAFLSVFKEKCFQPVNLQTDFRNAQKICTMFGGNLASVTNKYDNYLLTDKSSGTYWIGGAIDDKDEWKWTNGQVWNYTNWAEKEPKNQPNYCVKVIKSGGNPLTGDQKWASANCEQWAYFACETKPDYVPTVACPEGYHCFEDYAYAEFVPEKNFTDAEAHCQSLGGHLPSIHSAEEEAFFESIVNHTVLIGARFLPHGNDLDWTDGTKMNFIKWRPGNPVTRNQDTCVFVAWYNDAGWGTSSCREAWPFSCKIPLSKFQL